MFWDLFCKVVDNFGDVGVCWRLAADLAARGEQVRLWVDDASALQWMAPQGRAGVQVRHWTAGASAVEPAEVVVEAFGCELDPAFVLRMAEALRRGAPPVWINLEYLSAEPFVERAHGLPSPVLAGPGAGLVKHFFYPGFTARTGGLLREPGLADDQSAFGAPERDAWLAEHTGIVAQPGERCISLFCYEPPALAAWLRQLAAGPACTRLLVAAGRPAAAVRAAVAQDERLQSSLAADRALSISYLPWLSQADYDRLLWSCTLNFVRGEDSLVRALWAGRPFVWQLYPQDDEAHRAKLLAFLDTLEAPASLRRFSLVWNGLLAAPLPEPGLAEQQEWAGWARQVRQRLWQQPDLATQLLAWAVQHRPAAPVSPTLRGIP